MRVTLDPLEADNTNNLPVARMLYATPLEISGDNQLMSDVLETFSYDSATQTIHWLVKDGQKFDDGSPLLAQDVAFAVARMAYTRPQFPVIEFIDGLGAWLKSKEALKRLPSGIKVSGRKISIKLTKAVEHPLFRFCLELFSIIPQKCVDLKTNKLTCNDIPASGSYRIVKKLSDQVLFEKTARGLLRNDLISGRIQFDYIDSSTVIGKKLPPLSVIAGTELIYSPEQMKAVERTFTTKFTPASRFSAVLLNPKVKPFDQKFCRRQFSDVFRGFYAELEGKGKAPEGSIFTKVLPGYMTLGELKKNSQNPDAKIESNCEKAFSAQQLPWGFAEDEREGAFVKALKKTFAKLNIKTAEPRVAKNRGELYEWFAAGEVALVSGGSGFWALDPAGDLKMLFTPNLHKALSFVTQDDRLQLLLKDLETTPGNFKKINQHLFDESVFNVYTHLRRFYASPEKNLLLDVPFAITSPAPWQVFKKDK